MYWAHSHPPPKIHSQLPIEGVKSTGRLQTHSSTRSSMFLAPVQQVCGVRPGGLQEPSPTADDMSQFVEPRERPVEAKQICAVQVRRRSVAARSKKGKASKIRDEKHLKRLSTRFPHVSNLGSEEVRGWGVGSWLLPPRAAATARCAWPAICGRRTGVPTCCANLIYKYWQENPFSGAHLFALAPQVSIIELDISWLSPIVTQQHLNQGKSWT